MAGLLIYKGIGEDGADVTVLSGDPLSDDIAKAAATFTGAPLGAPKPGSVLTKVGAVDLVPSVHRVKAEDVLLTVKAEEPKPKSHAVPEAIAKRISMYNTAMLGPMCKSLKVKAEDAEMGLATGIVMEPGLVDTQGQTSTAEDIEKAMIYWACNGGSVDLMHSFEAITDERVDVVESWIVRAEFDLGGYVVKVGTWMMTTKWQTTGKYWDAIKAGTFNAYSIGGLGETVPLDGEGEAA